jgi:zinc/manganese transport system substrate-binding protein
MRPHHRLTSGAGAAVAALVLAGALAACGGSGSAAGGEGSGGRPTIVVTTTILGDVVTHLVGDQADVEVVMPPNADPHEFQASARQAAEMREADALVVNGGGFEAGLDDTIDGAKHDGVATFAAIDHVDTLDAGGEDGRSGGAPDPHFFSDPARMAVAAQALTEFLTAEVPALDTAGFRAGAGAYVARLQALDAEIEATLAPIPAERRKLVTNHDVFSYFADRYGFTIVGTVIPSITTQAEPSAGDLADLADAVRAAGVPAVFADTSSPERLADALAAEVPGVRVVELYSESLGPPGSDGDSYEAMMRTDAERIAGALTP